MKQTISFHRDDITRVVAMIKKHMEKYPIITFSGPLGAGKTTLIKHLLALCGVSESVTSPTFTYMNHYRSGDGSHFYHFDLYRLASLQEFYNGGFDEYLLQPHSWALIEWPELIEPLVHTHACHVTLDYGQDEHFRTLTITCP